MFFDNWAGLGRVLAIGPLAYVALVLVLRISGKRTLTKLNAFDLVVTVALGSTLATILLSKDVALAESVLVLALLVGMQFHRLAERPLRPLPRLRQSPAGATAEPGALPRRRPARRARDAGRGAGRNPLQRGR